MRLALLGLALLLASPVLSPVGAQEGDARAGRRLAGGRCAVCHGNDGIAVQPDAPNLAGQNPAYLAEQLRAFRDKVRVHEQMNLMAAALSETDIANLAAWYAAIEVTATPPGR